ncbi:MAG: NADH-quinone oxidoreductase subunit NuoE [Clostridia bacterium]|nr:NADH-quinone oxidoreductase subunit NuoE [Clostridia bacterium]
MEANGCKCEEELFAKLDQVIDQYRGQPSGLIQVLHQAQELFGYLPYEVQERVAEGLGVPLSEVYGVTTFYTFFSLYPKGRHQLKVCKGTACYVRGANNVIDRLEKELGIKPGETTEDRRFSLEVVRCLGACGLGPVMMVDEDVHARLKPDKLPQILSRYE